VITFKCLLWAFQYNMCTFQYNMCTFQHSMCCMYCTCCETMFFILICFKCCKLSIVCYDLHITYFIITVLNTLVLERWCAWFRFSNKMLVHNSVDYTYLHGWLKLFNSMHLPFLCYCGLYFVFTIAAGVKFRRTDGSSW
jgi:hypothetical protein